MGISELLPTRRAKRAEKTESNPFFIEFDRPDPAALELEWNLPDPADCAYRTGHRLLARGFFPEALELFERATRYDRAHYDAYVAQSETLILLGRAADAARVSEDAMNRYGRNCALGAARGHVFLHQKDFDRGASNARTSPRRTTPATPMAGSSPARRAWRSASRPTAAMTCFARSRAADERWPHLNVRIALAFLEWGHARCAAGFLEAIVRAEPDLPLAWMLLGDSLPRAGKGNAGVAPATAAPPNWRRSSNRPAARSVCAPASQPPGAARSGGSRELRMTIPVRTARFPARLPPARSILGHEGAPPMMEPAGSSTCSSARAIRSSTSAPARSPARPTSWPPSPKPGRRTSSSGAARRGCACWRTSTAARCRPPGTRRASRSPRSKPSSRTPAAPST